MKFSLKLIVISVFALFSAFKFMPEIKELNIGDAIPMPSHSMQDVISGKEKSLNDLKDKKGLLVIFSCNTCPYVKLSEQRIKDAAIYAQKSNIGVAIINSNEALRGEEDSFEAMKKYAADQKYTFSYMIDKNSELADAFGAKKTPEIFLFDSKGLVYKGAIDDNIKEIAAVKESYLKDAIDAVAKGKEVKTTVTKSIGCTIKRNA